MHRLIGDGQKVLAIFRSDDAYVLPEFYPTKPEHHRHVPTWSYHAVHVHGSIRFQHDTHAKRLAVGLLMRIDEQRVNGKAAWRMADATADYMEQMLGAIVAFSIEVNRTLAKSKLSRNRKERDYLGAIAGLRATGHQPLAKRMEHRLS